MRLYGLQPKSPIAAFPTTFQQYTDSGYGTGSQQYSNYETTHTIRQTAQFDNYPILEFSNRTYPK